MGEPADQKTSTTPTIWNSASYTDVVGHHEAVDTTKWGEGLLTDPASSAAFVDPHGHYVSPTEQSTVPGDPETNAYDQVPPFHSLSNQSDCEGIPTQEAPGTLFLNDIIHTTPPDSYLTKYASETQVNLPYDMLAADFAYYGTSVGYSAYQHVMQPSPIPPTDLPTLDHEWIDFFTRSHSPPNPLADQHHFEGQMAGVALENNHDPCGSGVETFPDSGGTHQPHPAPANGSECKTPKKRKRAVAPGKAQGVKRRRKSQLPDLRRLTQMSPPAILHTRHDLRMVESDLYQSENVQNGWIPRDPIVFKVKEIEGIKLTDAMNLRFDGPDDRDQLMFTDDHVGSSVSCRVKFAGYSTSSRPRQITTTNHKKKRSRITKEKLAYEVAKSVKSYLEELEEDGTPFTIPFEDMFLTRLVNVSRASWQPDLWFQVTPSSSS